MILYSRHTKAFFSLSISLNNIVNICHICCKWGSKILTSGLFSLLIGNVGTAVGVLTKSSQRLSSSSSSPIRSTLASDIAFHTYFVQNHHNHHNISTSLIISAVSPWWADLPLLEIFIIRCDISFSVTWSARQ